MKLPENFGNQGFGDALEQAKQTMARGAQLGGDDQEKPNVARQVARWILVAIMLLCVYQIGAGLYGMKHHTQIWAVWRLIEGSFFFILCYAAHWLLGS